MAETDTPLCVMSSSIQGKNCNEAIRYGMQKENDEKRLTETEPLEEFRNIPIECIPRVKRPKREINSQPSQVPSGNTSSPDPTSYTTPNMNGRLRPTVLQYPSQSILDGLFGLSRFPSPYLLMQHAAAAPM
eukprot:11373042-Ditylum_brightwellii.AAC.1